MDNSFDLQLRSLPDPAVAATVPMADTAHQTLCLDGVEGCGTVWATCYDTCCEAGSKLC